MARVKVGIIGGSGLGDALCGSVKGRKVEMATPFGSPSDAIIETSWSGVDVAVLNRHGPGHCLSPSNVNYRANIYALKALGCTHLIASGAVGSLREQIRPKDLVIPDQIIDRTYRRTPTFFDDGIVAHVEFALPFCQVLRKHLLNCAPAVTTTVHDGGTYVCMEGPAFSTRAESELHRAWGADLIGMTAMPEAKLAREAELAYALVCLPSDYDCWRPAPAQLDKHELLKEIIGNLNDATANAIELIKAAVGRMPEIADAVSPCHTPQQDPVKSGIFPHTLNSYLLAPLQTQKDLNNLIAMRAQGRVPSQPRNFNRSDASQVMFMDMIMHEEEKSTATVHYRPDPTWNMAYADGHVEMKGTQQVAQSYAIAQPINPNDNWEVFINVFQKIK